MSWKYFNGNCQQDEPAGLAYPADGEASTLPDRPPWRQFLAREAIALDVDRQYWQQLRDLAQGDERAMQRGKTFRVREDPSEIVDAVNAAIHLRRPLLVTGVPGSGKTSLAYAIAYELQLGPVLTWPITARANLVDAEYRYDAIARLQDVQLDKMRQVENDGNDATQSPLARQAASDGDDDAASGAKSARQEEGGLGDYIQLGPVGTAFLPSLLPRVLLIDEIDKSDLNLPNDLLNLFEEGEFEIPELVRRKRRRGGEQDATVEVRTADKDMVAKITNGHVKCCEFPIVIMTSNGERDFPPAFYRRCLRVKMPDPTSASLVPIVQSHFAQADATGWTQTEANLTELIGEFIDRGNKADRATDQLLNAIYLMTREERPSPEAMKRLQALLFKRLSEGDG